MTAKLRIMRRKRDSNPRYCFQYTRFPGVPHQPLEHLSNVFQALDTRAYKSGCKLQKVYEPTIIFEKYFFINDKLKLRLYNNTS